MASNNTKKDKNKENNNRNLVDQCKTKGKG